MWFDEMNNWIADTHIENSLTNLTAKYKDEDRFLLYSIAMYELKNLAIFNTLFWKLLTNDSCAWKIVWSLTRWHGIWGGAGQTQTGPSPAAAAAKQMEPYFQTLLIFLSTRKTPLPTAAQSRVGSELGASAAQGQTGPARPTPLEVWECAQICCCNPPCTGNAMDTNSQETMTKTRRSANDGR